MLDLVAVRDTDVTTLLRLPAIDRTSARRGVTLRIANANEELTELGLRTPGVAELCDRGFPGINDAIAESSPGG